MATVASMQAGISGRAPRRLRVALAFGAPVVFAAGQIALEWRHEQLLRSFISARSLAPVPFTLGDGARNVGWSLATYAVLALAGVVLALRGYRFAWAAPAAIFVLGNAIGAGHYPETIGVAWMGPQAIDGHSMAHWYAQLWAGAVTDLVLVSLPVVPFLRAGDSPRPAWRFDRPSALALLLVATGIAMVLRTNAVMSDAYPRVTVLASACVFALLAGSAQPWWPWAQFVVAFGLSGTLGGLLWVAFPSGGIEISVWAQISSVVPDAIPVVACALIASLWEPLSRMLRRGSLVAA